MEEIKLKCIRAAYDNILDCLTLAQDQLCILRDRDEDLETTYVKLEDKLTDLQSRFTVLRKDMCMFAGDPLNVEIYTRPLEVCQVIADEGECIVCPTTIDVLFERDYMEFMVTAPNSGTNEFEVVYAFLVDYLHFKEPDSKGLLHTMYLVNDCIEVRDADGENTTISARLSIDPARSHPHFGSWCIVSALHRCDLMVSTL